ncbi:MAG: ATP-grasp domain-containing protein [Clostridia bacterium]|nr:ATP-grasp domain-containing protein [Clostridia bacterium]
MIVVVTGVHAGCQRSPGFAVAKALSNDQYVSLVAIDYDELSTGLLSSEFSQTQILQWSSDPDLLLGELVDILKEKAVDIIIPCLNNDAAIIAKNMEKFTLSGAKCLLPAAEAFRYRKKSTLPKFAKKNGFEHPVTIVCHNKEEIASIGERIGFPCVIKGDECGIFPVRQPDLFSYYAFSCAKHFGFPFVVQEWLEGEEFSVAGLCDQHSIMLSVLVVKKIGIADDGEGWMNTVVYAPELERAAKKLSSSMQWIGPIEYDFIRNEQGTYLLDVNPRFPAWIDGPAQRGFNLPSLLVSLVAEKDVTLPALPPAGTIFYKDFEDIFLPISSAHFKVM